MSAAAKAKKPEAPPTPTPVATPVAPVVAPYTGKQEATLANLITAWTARGVDVSKLTTTMDGKFLVVVVGSGWPEIRIGNGGGLDIPSIRSYAKAFDACVIADQLLAKQISRATKPTTPTAPVAKTPEAPKPEVTGEVKIPTLSHKTRQGWGTPRQKVKIPREFWFPRTHRGTATFGIP